MRVHRLCALRKATGDKGGDGQGEKKTGMLMWEPQMHQIRG